MDLSVLLCTYLRLLYDGSWKCMTSRFSGQPSDRCGQLDCPPCQRFCVLKACKRNRSLQQTVFITYYCSTGHLFKNHRNYSVLNMSSVDHYFVSYFLSSLSSDLLVSNEYVCQRRLFLTPQFCTLFF